MGGVRADARTFALSVVTVLFVAACGSTVPVSEQQAAEIADDELGGDLVAGTPELPPGARINKKGQVVSADGEVLGTAEEFGLTTGSDGGVAAGNGGSPELSGGGSGDEVAAAAPGVTASKIYFGITYFEAGPVNQAAFGESLDADPRKPYNAMIEIINKQGGLFGRQIEPIYYKIDAASSQPVEQQQQAACSHWTEDNEVFGILAGDDVFKECAKRAGIFNTTSSDGASLPDDFQNYPTYFESSSLNLVRVGPVTVTGLHRQKYFGTDPKIGFVLWDEPNYRASLEQGYLPALRKKGLEMATEPAYVSAPQTAGDLSATSADINSAVLRFQTQGITHVFLLDGQAGLCGGACLSTFFFRRADSQEYFPRYGLNAYNQAKTGLSAGLYPARQLRRSIAVEWADFDESYDEGWKVNQARERCYELMREAGVPLDNPNRQHWARTACEQMWLFQLVQQLLGDAPLSTNNFMVGINSVGSRFQSPNAFAVHLSETQHDAVAAARNMKFVESCTCYRWTSDPYRV